MAERRMFAKSIIDSDVFLDMPLSAQALYFHLSMRADDDGFVNNPKQIQRMIGASNDDCNLLTIKRFIIAFENGIIVIRHWRIHNYIQKDRYKETAYKEEKEQLLIEDNNTYKLKQGEATIESKSPVIESSEKTIRQKAYEESELPYSFDYKIRAAFVGKCCPVCGCRMGYENNLVKPTIQHNVPISKGGKHELGNISVICQSCNTSIQDNETGKLNADDVVEAWEKISCTRSVHEMDTQVSIGKVSIGKDSIEIECAGAREIEGEKKAKSKGKTSVEIISDFSDDEDLKLAILAFVDMRKLIKKPMSERALTLMLHKLASLSGDAKTQVEILNQSVLHSWQDVYPLKDEPPKPQGKPKPKPESFDADDFMAAALARSYADKGGGS